jgi:hypothetical protein
MTEEPEVTQEMIEAGRQAHTNELARVDESALQKTASPEAVAAIYRAMHKKRPEGTTGADEPLDRVQHLSKIINAF